MLSGFLAIILAAGKFLSQSWSPHRFINMMTSYNWCELHFIHKVPFHIMKTWASHGFDYCSSTVITYLIVNLWIYNPGQNYLRICTPPCTLSNATTLFQQQLICGTKSPSPQVNVVSYKCLRIRVALEHTTTLLPRGGGKGGRGIARMLGKMLCECDIFSTVLS